jgi:Protein of unknown function (DUF2950)
MDMSLSIQNNARSFRPGLFLTLLVLIVSLVSCRRPETVSASKEAHKTFASPQEAGATLLEAAKSGNQAALIEIFGPDGREILFSGDAVKDKNALLAFIAAYEKMNRWGKINDGGQMLYVGAENFPFPIPLQQNSSGQWYFDTGRGADEILARRIGRDELIAMAAMSAIANAQQQYYHRSHEPGKAKQYAQKFVSDEGAHNGLYWPSSEGHPPSPLGQLGDFAKGAGYTNAGGNPQPFNGYFFRILTKQGSGAKGGAKDYVVNGNLTDGFAILAYPAEYRNSGIMTFLIGADGVLYQKDLGEKTGDVAVAITEYNPGDSWKRVE